VCACRRKTGRNKGEVRTHTIEIAETPCIRDGHLEIVSSQSDEAVKKHRPYKAAVVMLCNHVTRLAELISAAGFCSQFMTVKLTLIWLFLPDEAWFHLHGHVSSQNNLYWGSVNPYLIHEVPPYDVKVGMWCAVGVKRITGPIFYAETINSGRYVRLTLTEFFAQLTEEEQRSYAWFQ
jgi:hypothetical protein